MGSMGLVTAMMCTHLAVGSLPTEPLHMHPTVLGMLARNNELRLSVGLSEHRISPELTKAAQDHAVYMAQSGVFDHYANAGPQGRASRHGYQGTVLENIAMGYGTIEAAFAGWRGSSGHWASIVSGAPEAGFGFAVNSAGVAYWVGVYGYPARHEAAKPVIGEDGATTAPTTYYTYPTEQRRRGLFRRWRR